MDQKTLKNKLILLANEKHIEFSNKLKINDQYEILGLKIFEIKNIAKQLSREEGINHINDFLMYKEPIFYEELIITYFTFSFFEKNLNRNDFYNYLDQLLKYNNSWATNDTIALSIKPRKKDLFSYYDYLLSKLESKNFWDIRFSIVCLMKSYLTNDYVNETLYHLSKIDNEEYYVEMALGWAFATALAKQREATYPYIFEKKINNKINKKAIQKSIESKRISDIDKEKLKVLRNEINLELKNF